MNNFGYDEILKIKIGDKEHLIIHFEEGTTLLIHSTEKFTRRMEGIDNCLKYLKGRLTDQYICKIEQIILELV